MVTRLFALMILFTISITVHGQGRGTGGGGATGGGGFAGGQALGTGGTNFGTNGNLGNGSALTSAFAAGASSATGSTGQLSATGSQGGLGLGLGAGIAQAANPFAMSANAFSFGGSNSLVGSAIMSRSMGGMLGGMGGMGMGGMGMGGMTGRGMTGANSQNQSPVRATVRLGFTMPLAPADQRSQIVQTRLGRLPLGNRVRNPQLSIAGRTVTIRGEVASQDDARMVERLLKLEPGIDEVVNQLAVATNSGSATPPTTTVVPLPIVPTPAQNN